MGEQETARDLELVAAVLDDALAAPGVEAKLGPRPGRPAWPATTAPACGSPGSDATWWFENAEEVETRWQEFKLGL
jgi:hypothetical protein